MIADSARCRPRFRNDLRRLPPAVCRSRMIRRAALRPELATVGLSTFKPAICETVRVFHPARPGPIRDDRQSCAKARSFLVSLW